MTDHFSDERGPEPADHRLRHEDHSDDRHRRVRKQDPEMDRRGEVPVARAPAGTVCSNLLRFIDLFITFFSSSTYIRPSPLTAFAKSIAEGLLNGFE